MIKYSPLASVLAPCDVPLTRTLQPTSAPPELASVTIPAIFPV